MTDNIVELNKEAEQFVIQAEMGRSRHYFGKLFGDKYTPLTFVHAADMHADTVAWNRMVEYVNGYKEYLSEHSEYLIVCCFLFFFRSSQRIESVGIFS